MLPVPPVVTSPAGCVGDRVGVEQVERHGDDLALEPRRARAHVALQRVHVGEQPERLVEEVVVLVVAAVHRPGALAGLPERVLLLRHHPQLLEHLLAGPAVLGERAVDAEALGVGEAIAHSRAPQMLVLMTASACSWISGEAAATTKPPPAAGPPRRPVTTPPAASTIGIRATMS